MIGEVLNKDYKITEVIGEGAMGKVYRARQISLNRDVAIKVLPDSLSKNREFVKRFDIEAKSVASLAHQNIIQMYSKGVTQDGIHFFAMEYVDGEDLHAKLERGEKYSEYRTIEIVIQVCQGLECAWKKNIIHRDIKPSNIIMNSDGLVKIADFGLAKCLETTNILTQTNIFIGTPYYSSPEQIERKPVDHRTDVYSLGIVLYQLLTNNVPFEGKNAEIVFFQHVKVKPKPPRNINSKISRQIERVVLKAIEKLTDDRYQNTKEFREALEKVQQMWNEKKKDESSGIDTEKTTIRDGIKIPRKVENKKFIFILPTIILTIILFVSGWLYFDVFIKYFPPGIKQLNDKLVSPPIVNVVDTFDELVKSSSKSLFANLLEKNALNVITGKLTLRDTNYSSEFAYRMMSSIEDELKRPEYRSIILSVTEINITYDDIYTAQSSSQKNKVKQLDTILEGYYWAYNDTIFVNLQLIDHNGKVISIAKGEIKSEAIKYKLEPDNFNKVRKIEKEILSLPQRKNDFNTYLWINRGNGGIYTTGEEVKLFFKSEIDCYLKVLYIDVNGNRIIFYPSDLDPKTKLKKDVIYKLHENSSIEVVPPFGPEIIMAFASNKPFDLGETDLGNGYKGFKDEPVTAKIIGGFRELQKISNDSDKGSKISEVMVYLTTIRK